MTSTFFYNLTTSARALLCSVVLTSSFHTLQAQVLTTPRKASELTFVLPQEGPKTLSQYKGKVVALEFILTTCIHCQAASKVMTKLQAELGSQGLQVLDVAINGLDENRDAKAAEALVSAFQSNFQAGFPVGWVKREEMLAFLGVSVMERLVVPQLVLIDRQGYIHYQTPPMGDEHSMMEGTIRERLQELLSLRQSVISSKIRPAHKKQT